MKNLILALLIICFSFSPVLATPWGTGGGVSEGTDILSTGEEGGTKYLREDGDGTCSWQVPAGSGDLLADGTTPMTANWDIGSFWVQGTQFRSDIATGTAPFVVASTTVVANLNADLLDGVEGAGYQTILTNEAGLYAALSDVADFVQTVEIDTVAELETVSNGGAYMSDILAATSEANFKSITNLEDSDFIALLTDGNIPNDITIDLATLATTFTCTDNESTDEDAPVVFVDGATGAQGGETDGDFTYNPSTGTLKVTIVEASGGLTSGTATDPYIAFLVTDADDTDWWIGVNADAGASSDDNMEFRMSATPGASVHSWLEPDTGDVVYEGATDDAHNLLFDIKDPTGSRVVTFDDNNVNFSHTNEDYVLKYNASTRTWAGEADSTGSALGSNLTSSTDDITSDSNTIRLASNGENIDLDYSANLVSVTTTTGVTLFDFGTINLATDALDLSSGSITNMAVGGLPDNTVDNGCMADNAIDTAELADDAVDSAEITDGAVDLAHMSTDSVDYTKTTGSSKALTPILDDADDFSTTFTGANLYGGTFLCNGTGDVDLPSPVEGMHFTVVTFGDIEVEALPDTGDDLILDGAQLDANHKAKNASTAGDIAVFQYYDATGWLVSSNSWTEVAD